MNRVHLASIACLVLAKLVVPAQARLPASEGAPEALVMITDTGKPISPEFLELRDLLVREASEAGKTLEVIEIDGLRYTEGSAPIARAVRAVLIDAGPYLLPDSLRSELESRLAPKAEVFIHTPYESKRDWTETELSLYYRDRYLRPSSAGTIYHLSSRLHAHLMPSFAADWLKVEGGTITFDAHLDKLTYTGAPEPDRTHGLFMRERRPGARQFVRAHQALK